MSVTVILTNRNNKIWLSKNLGNFIVDIERFTLTLRRSKMKNLLLLSNMNNLWLTQLVTRVSKYTSFNILGVLMGYFSVWLRINLNHRRGFNVSIIRLEPKLGFIRSTSYDNLCYEVTVNRQNQPLRTNLSFLREQWETKSKVRNYTNVHIYTLGKVNLRRFGWVLIEIGNFGFHIYDYGK